MTKSSLESALFGIKLALVVFSVWAIAGLALPLGFSMAVESLQLSSEEVQSYIFMGRVTKSLTYLLVQVAITVAAFRAARATEGGRLQTAALTVPSLIPGVGLFMLAYLWHNLRKRLSRAG